MFIWIWNSYELSDGTRREESGGFNANGIWEVRGSFSFFGDDGVTHSTTFIADDQGYRVLEDGAPSINRNVPANNNNRNPDDISNIIDVRLSETQNKNAQNFAAPSQFVDQPPNLVQ